MTSELTEKNASKSMARTGPKKAAGRGFKIGPGRHFPSIHLRLIWLQKATGRQKKIHLAVNHFRPIREGGSQMNISDERGRARTKNEKGHAGALMVMAGF
jgi:hypothetical protein